MPENRSDELDLHSLTRVEALVQLDAFLNASFLAGRSRLKIIHGKGSGVLREAVRQSLKEHPLVDAYYPVGESEGDLGVTVVRLANKYHA